MKENLPQRSEDEQLLNQADYLINSLWEKAMDVDDLPLSVDPTYQVWADDLERHKGTYAKILFDKTRQASGTDKLRYAKTNDSGILQQKIYSRVY